MGYLLQKGSCNRVRCHNIIKIRRSTQKRYTKSYKLNNNKASVYKKFRKKFKWNYFRPVEEKQFEITES